MTPEQADDLKVTWGEAEYVLRDAMNAPDWAHFIDHEGTAYSVEYLAEEWIQSGAVEGERELMIMLSPELTSQIIFKSIRERVKAGELCAVVDSPDDWK
nr:MAG TPA: hypothetical protein [Caudoviricetes sp.]